MVRILKYDKITATNQQKIGEPENNRKSTESRRADQERDRERNNQRFAELWRKIGEVKDKLFNTARANHEIERNLGAASRNAATAKHNLDAINQSLEQNRKAEQRKSRGWSMSR